MKNQTELRLLICLFIFLSANILAQKGISTADCQMYIADNYEKATPVLNEGPEKHVKSVYIVPNFHPASCGWLTDWSTERNYCANSYLDHLDRVRDDSTYNFALSECNNMIAILNFTPQRFVELKQRIHEGRVELCNAFFLEPTINLSGGEALVKMGIEGLRWQKQVMGVSPRLSWMIDVTGVHEQMAQIVSGLGLEALVYCRLNPTGSTLHWMESPDGTRILAISPGHYIDWTSMFRAKEPLDEKQLQLLAEDIRSRIEPLASDNGMNRSESGDLRSPVRRVPSDAPVLILGGSGDYNLAPLCKDYPSLFLKQFSEFAPQYELHFSTPGHYLDAVLPGIKTGAIQLPTMYGGTKFTYNAFWIQNPRVKTWYRKCEQELQAAEMYATIASLMGNMNYPVQNLYHAWLQLLLNMDRNTLWGSAGGMVFENEHSWDVRDRFESVEQISLETLTEAARILSNSNEGMTIFNPLNWKRKSPIRLPSPVGTKYQAIPGSNDFICQLDLPSMSVSGFNLLSRKPVSSKSISLPSVIETRYYSVRIDPVTGALTSLRLKSSNEELLGGPANVIVAERPKKRVGPGDHMSDRPDRDRLTDSNASSSRITVSKGPLAIVVEVTGSFIDGSSLRRQMIFYNDYPGIEFETELNNITDGTVVVAEFPLAGPVKEVRRGVPYGFSHASRADGDTNTGLHGVTSGITPAVRWSHYQMDECGIALLDQGLSGREINGNTPVIFLLNAVEKYRGYPNSWLSGTGKHVLRYSLLAHKDDFTDAGIPHAAWEFALPLLFINGGKPAKTASVIQTSENVIVEAMRREGYEIELRLAECLGCTGNASVTLNLPHIDAALTNMIGGNRKSLTGGPTYKFHVNPQQIVTMRFKTNSSVSGIKPLTDWEELVPPGKLETLRRYLPDRKGHPPSGGQ